jgi:hypothetical protein
MATKKERQLVYFIPSSFLFALGSGTNIPDQQHGYELGYLYCTGISLSTPSLTSASKYRQRYYQCCGSMTFWGGSGSADPCL